MNGNLFENSPTVGSNDDVLSVEKLGALLETLPKLQKEFEMLKNQQSHSFETSKISVDAIKEIFVEVIIPLVNAAGGLGNLGQLINAIARYKAVSQQNSILRPHYPPHMGYPIIGNGYYDESYGMDSFNQLYHTKFH